MNTARSTLTLQRQLERELKHLQWLKRQPSLAQQLRCCRKRILILRTELAYKSCAANGRTDHQAL